LQLLFDDGDQHVRGDGAPYLRLHGVLAGAEKALDAKVLLDPFEEHRHLPAALVEGADGRGRQAGVVGQEDQCPARLGVFEADAAKVLRIVGGRVEAVEHHALIANHPIGAVRGVRVDPSRIHVRLGAGDEERTGLMHRVQAPEVHVAAIHDVETARLDEQQVEHVDIVQLAIADVDEGWNGAAQIEQGVQFDGRLVGTKRRPVEQAQAEIDGGRVQRIDARIELQQRRFLRIQRSCAGDQPLGQAVKDAPIAPAATSVPCGKAWLDWPPCRPRYRAATRAR
jgi:hypothetical protein